MTTLPERQRQVLELGYFAELSHAEIASRLDIPLGTVKGRSRLGLQKLAGAALWLLRIAGYSASLRSATARRALDKCATESTVRREW